MAKWIALIGAVTNLSMVLYLGPQLLRIYTTNSYPAPVSNYFIFLFNPFILVPLLFSFTGFMYWNSLRTSKAKTKRGKNNKNLNQEQTSIIISMFIVLVPLLIYFLDMFYSTLVFKSLY